MCNVRKVRPPATLTLKIQWVPYTYRQTGGEAAADAKHHGRLHGLFHHKVRASTHYGMPKLPSRSC